MVSRSHSNTLCISALTWLDGLMKLLCIKLNISVFPFLVSKYPLKQCWLARLPVLAKT